MKRSAAVALAVLAATGCDNVRGRSCVTTADCGDPSVYICRYPLPGVDPICPTHGTCARFDSDCVPASPVVDPPNTIPYCSCGGPGQFLTLDAICPDHAVFAYPVTTGAQCGCSALQHDAVVHAGPRGPTEYCTYSDGGGWDWPVCCDCSLAFPNWDFCRSTAGVELPASCCNCFTETEPDPTGRCVPPPSPWPAGVVRWCCAITEDPDAGIAPDSGAH